jgi:hypothetical protein
MSADLATDDTAYRALLSDLEVGRLGPEQIERLMVAAHSRLCTVFGDEVGETLASCTDIFGVYDWRVHEARTIKQTGRKIQKAAAALADALASTGRSDCYQLLDPGIWGDCPDDYVGPNIRIEDYLRMLAKHFSQLDSTDLAAYADLVPGRHSVNLRRPVIRHVANHLIDMWQRGELRDEPADPEDVTRLPYRMHQHIAGVTSVMLATEINATDVNDAINKKA